MSSTLKKADVIPLSDNAKVVLAKRYFAKDANGKTIEDEHGLFTRVAQTVAAADSRYGANAESVSTTAQRFYDMMTRLEFIPNSPTLMNAGRPLGQLSACFVLPVEDSIDKIFDSLKYMALIHKSGGGTGFSFSRLRPRDDMVLTTAGVSSGPVSFMNIFNAATETIKQGGTRRGANMAILSVDHPDILEFIKAKEDTTQLTNFNISVALTDRFMKAVENGESYSLINPRNGKETGKLDARDVFKLIVKMAWTNGEPGIVFIDRINAKNPLMKIGAIESTNPCGEQPLLPFESCNLGSINLIRFAVQKDGNWQIDFDALATCVADSVHFLDNVIDVNNYPLDEIANNTRANRKIGLGVMGFADLLIRLGIPYNSESAVSTAEDIMSFIQKKADEASIALAQARGTFPNFAHSLYADSKTDIRNATRTTIAPTGTISIIANTSSGVEPLFALAYTRNIMDGHKLVEIDPVLKDILTEQNLYSEALIQKIAEKGTVAHLDDVPEDLKRVLVTSHEIDPEWHIRIQAAFQKYTDNAVSKTINFHSDATVEDIEKAYMLAYQLDCKGITVYRDGSRSGQVLEVKKEPKKEPEQIVSSDGFLEPKPRKDETRGTTRKMSTGCGALYVTINEDDDGLFEVFAIMGKGGGCAASQTEAISRLISLSLRCGIDPAQIVKQIRGVRCPNQVWDRGGRIYSCADAIAKAIERYLGLTDDSPTLFENAKSNAETHGKGSESAMVGVCPECHAPLEFSSGCSVCKDCGFSRCG